MCRALASQLSCSAFTKCQECPFQPPQQPKPVPAIGTMAPDAAASCWSPSEVGWKDTRLRGASRTERASGGRGGRESRGTLSRFPLPPPTQGPDGLGRQGRTSSCPQLPACAERAASARFSRHGRQTKSEPGRLSSWFTSCFTSQFPLVFHAVPRELDTYLKAAAPVSRTPPAVRPDSTGDSSN